MLSLSNLLEKFDANILIMVNSYVMLVKEGDFILLNHNYTKQKNDLLILYSV